MFNKIITGLCMLVSCLTQAQHINFSQYTHTPLLVNPAWVGATPHASVALLYRDHNYSGNYDFKSAHLTLMYPLFLDGKKAGRMGVSLLNDRTGPGGVYTFQMASLNLAHTIQMTRAQHLSVGLQGHYHFRRFSTEGLTTGSQYHQEIGFDPAIDAGEDFTELRHRYVSFSTGLLWHTQDRDEETTFYTGLALYNLNRPNESFFEMDRPLPVRFHINGGFKLYHQGRVTIFPEWVLMHAAGTTLLNLGSQWIYQWVPDSRKGETAKLVLSTRYIVNKTAVVALQFTKEHFTVGFGHELGTRSDDPFTDANEYLLSLHKQVVPQQKNKKIRQQKKKGKRRNRESANTRGRIDRSIPFLSSLPPDTAMVWKQDFDDRLKQKAEKLDQSIRGKISMALAGQTFEFGFNETRINPQSRPYLNALVRQLQEYPQRRIKLTGHTDNIGSQAVNQKISLLRAQAVKQYLIQHGIDSSRIATVGKGSTEPLYPNSHEILRAKNRRVSFVLEP